MNNLTVFNFKESDVRVLNIDNEPWFVAKDLCDVLELKDVSMSLKRLDNDEKGTNSICTLGGNQDMAIVSESGMYSLVLTSRKPQAKAFKKWITSQVLPSIRETGKYEIEPQQPSLPNVNPHTTLDVIQGTQALFEIMNITPKYLPGLVAEAVKESHPEMSETVEQMKILMASNSENDIENQSFTVTEIGEMLDPTLSAVKVNKLLHGMGYQEKINKRWVLTEEGKENGGVVIATTKKNLKDNVEQIRWKEEIVDRINEFLEN